jgi:hypothetical protein
MGRMMNKTTIREMLPSETPLLVKWLYAHKDVNQVDLEVFRRGQVRIFVAEKDEKIVYFMPIKSVYWFEAGAPNPEATPSEIGQAFSAMNDFLIARAREENVSTVFVQPSDEKFSNFVQTHFNYEPVTRPTLEFNFNAAQETAKCV